MADPIANPPRFVFTLGLGMPTAEVMEGAGPTVRVEAPEPISRDVLVLAPYLQAGHSTGVPTPPELAKTPGVNTVGSKAARTFASVGTMTYLGRVPREGELGIAFGLGLTLWQDTASIVKNGNAEGTSESLSIGLENMGALMLGLAGPLAVSAGWRVGVGFPTTSKTTGTVAKSSDSMSLAGELTLNLHLTF